MPNFIETYLVGFHFLSGKFTWNLVRIRTEIYLVRFQQNKGKVQDICRWIIIIHFESLKCWKSGVLEQPTVQNVPRLVKERLLSLNTC